MRWLKCSEPGPSGRASPEVALDTAITVTCFMPGPTDTEFLRRADMMDTKVGQDDSKADPAEVAKIGLQAMMDGGADVAAGWKNKVQVAMAGVTPATVLAEQQRKMAEPSTGERASQK